MDTQGIRHKPSKIERYEVQDVEYDFSRASQIILPEDITLATKTASNDSPYDTTSTLSMEITESTTSEWSTTAGVEMHTGVTTTVTAGIPIFAEVTTEWEVGLLASFSYTYGKSFTSSVTTNHEISVVLPAYSDVQVAMSAKKATVSVPYTATVKIFYKRANPEVKSNVMGVYKDVHFTSFKTSVETIEMNRTRLYDKEPLSGAVTVVPVWSIFISCNLFVFFV
ncbi:Natterin-3 [Holothuria leucospilota]|uniref:Natterin-3 n=1 Tax=Holothuria leucospilota TaxID=206669 RepID=A0A9Q0YSD6_HOLLE|nr:Natterin-3 [Holothuria leucospilota]